MLKSMLAAVLLSVSLSVGATGNHNPPKPTPPAPTTQTQGQNQNQSQGQSQGQAQNSNANANVKNSNDVNVGVKNTVGVNNSVKNDVKNTNTNVNNVKGGDSQSSSNSDSSASADNSNSGNSNVVVEGDSTVYKAPKIPVSSAIAPSIIVAGEDSCQQATSAAVQAKILGISFGKSTVDQDCELRKDSREAYNQGHAKTAFARWCQDPRNAQAAKDAGEKCPDGTPDPVVAPPAAVVDANCDAKVEKAFKACVQK